MSVLADKTIAVTGAGSGIGRALALELAERGARLAVADRDSEGLAETGRLLGNRPHWARLFDVTDHAALAGFIDGAAAEFGALDGIINNAGLTVVAPFEQTPREEFDRVMDVNFRAVVEGCRLALPHLRCAGGGWIVNISSVFGMFGFPTQSAYNASKFAVRGFTEALAIELQRTDPGIAVIRVHPGGVRTNVVRRARILASMPDMPTAFDAADRFDAVARTSPEDAARTIVRGMEQRRLRVLIGRDARMADWIVRLFPEHYWRHIGRSIRPA